MDLSLSIRSEDDKDSKVNREILHLHSLADIITAKPSQSFRSEVPQTSRVGYSSTTLHTPIPTVATDRSITCSGSTKKLRRRRKPTR